MKLITRVTLPLTITALALAGCSAPDTPTEPASPTQSASATQTPSSTPTATPTPDATKTTEPTKATPQPAPDTLDTTSGVAWYTDQEDPALLSQHGLIADIYYPRMNDRETMCAQSQPNVCTTPADRLALMDASIDQFQDDYAEENPGTGTDMDDAPLREQDPYAGLSDAELEELPVTGMP